uniref:Uncharacterized protein n=1 Tax=Helianthus annuus TaxID=4232 RepID=A0A251T7U1_HELAN
MYIYIYIYIYIYRIGSICEPFLIYEQNEQILAVDLIKLNIRVGLSFNIYIFFNSNFLFQKLCSVTRKNNHPSCHNSISIHDGKKNRLHIFPDCSSVQEISYLYHLRFILILLH